MAYVEVEGARIWYQDRGGDGPLIVLLHAAAGHSECWEGQVPAFTTAGLRVFTYDLRGFGKTEPEPGKETQGSIAGDLEAMMGKLGLPPFFLAATAYGGFGGLEFALDNPEKTRALVLSTSFGGISDPEFAAERARHVRPDLRELPVVERELGATYRAANPEGTRRWLAMEQSSYKADGARQTLRQPTTLKRLGRFEVIKGAGHSAYWEQPEVWNGLVLSFIREHI